MRNFVLTPQFGGFKEDVNLTNCYVFPGSFNPITHGHYAIMKSVLKMKGERQFFFEITIDNPDKKTKPDELLYDIYKQFEKLKLCTLWDSYPLFKQKINDLQKSKIVVGTDTLIRILDLKYYKGGIAELEEFRESMVYKSIQFIVVPRYNKTTDCVESLDYILEQVKLEDFYKDKWKSLLDELEGFRIDISMPRCQVPSS